MMRRSKGVTEFRNWAGNQSCLPMFRSAPVSTEAVADRVTAAAASGRQVKVVGSAHSFTAAACTDGDLLSLEHFSALEDFDPASGEVTVGAGIQLRRLNDDLHALGRALPNLGDIDVQTLGGATATATHGTGRELGNLATNIVGFELVTGRGEVVWCDRVSNPEIFDVGRVSIGALGVITRMRLTTVPAFVLHARESGRRLDDVLDDWADFIGRNRHAELFFIPGHSTCLTKENNPTDSPAQPQGRIGHFVDKEIGENLVVDLANRVVARFPSSRSRVLRAWGRLPLGREVTDRSDRVFCSTRRVRFVEMEYAVPIDAIPDAVREVAAFAAGLPQPPLFPVEVRTSAGDDIALSTAQGRDSGWIAVHQYRGVPFADYFRGVEAILDRYEGRPHWGKMHFQTAATLRRRYPRWDDFETVRAEVDPDGRFRNDYTDRVLGPIAERNAGTGTSAGSGAST